MKKRGFTLIELMIVIAIIALLAAIALPKFSSASEAAKVANVQGNLANIRTALAIHYAKHRTYPTYANNATSIQPDGDIGATSNFINYFSKTAMPDTPAGNNVTAVAANLNNVANGTTVVAGADGAYAAGSAGWVYNATTGDIHAYLPLNAYDGGIKWSEE